MTVATEVVTIKAQPFKSLLKFLEKDLTLEQREAALAALPPEYRQYTQNARVTGWMQELGEMTKVPNLQIVHGMCRGKGAPDCQWSVTWE
jgi:hypothetical protein